MGLCQLITLWISTCFILMPIKGQFCGVDCHAAGCNDNETTCEQDANCRFLSGSAVNPNGILTSVCVRLGTCDSDCTLCPDTVVGCSDGTTGSKANCFIAGSGDAAGQCVGGDCETDCASCAIPPDCERSSAEPNGCVYDGMAESCDPDTLNPTIHPSTEPTMEPTTSEPTTAEPTTAEPTTAEPTTAEPTTSEPTTAEPTTAEPTTSEPTTAEPTTSEPTPRPTPGPIMCNDTLSDPFPFDAEFVDFLFDATALPSGEDTIVTISTCNDNNLFDTILEIYDGMLTLLDSDDNGCPDPASSSILEITGLTPGFYIVRLRSAFGAGIEGDYELSILCDEPTTANPTTSEPTTAEPTTAEPTTSEPTTDEPTTAEPTTAEPTTSEPTTGEPTTAVPTGGDDVSECPECPYNVTLTAIGNVSIVECPEPTPSPTWSKSGKNRWNGRGRRRRRRRRLGGGYNKKNSYDKSKSKKSWNTTPSPSPWLKDRACIETDDETHRRRLWGNYRKKSRDDSAKTPSPTKSDGFDEWYTEKCDIKDSSDGWDNGYDSGSSYGKESGYGSRWTSWRKRRDETDEFLTEVCVTYSISGGGQSEDCEGVTSIFLGLCENNNTDFNSSSLDTDDLDKIVSSIDNGGSVIGAITLDLELGLLVTFPQSNVTEFELCLGNVTVDSQFNEGRDMIDIGNGTYSADGEQCTSDGLPCLNFFFDIPCPPTTTDDFRDCDCEKGITEMSILYSNVNDTEAASITVYYKRSNIVLCEFTDVASGDNITCSSTPYSFFASTTYVVINYADDEPERRRLGGSRRKSSITWGDCNGKIYTTCSKQLIGATSDGCDDLSVISYIDGVGDFCDESIYLEEQEAVDGSNALIDGELSINSAFDVIQELDPYVRYTLISVLCMFVILTCIGCYICVINKNGDEKQQEKEAQLKETIENAANVVQETSVKKTRREDKDINDGEEEEEPEEPFYDEKDLKNMPMVEMVTVQEVCVDNDDDDEYYDGDIHIE